MTDELDPYEKAFTRIAPAFGHLYYVLDGHEVRPTTSLLEWARMFEGEERRVAQTEVAPGIRVSTVFLGLDHRFWGDGPPLLFETMAFSDTDTDVADAFNRYATWAEAEAGHAAAVAELQERLAHQ